MSQASVASRFRWVLPTFLAVAGIASFIWYWNAPSLPIRLIAAVITAALWVASYTIFDRSYVFARRVLTRYLVAAGVVLALLIAIPFTAPPRESCFDAIDKSRSQAAVETDYLYCETQATNIWKPDHPTMLTSNKKLVTQNYDRLMWAVNGQPEPGFLKAALDEGQQENIGYKLSHIYEKWPHYEDRPFIVIGQVHARNEFSDDGKRADWIYQLGTTRDAGQVMYVRIMRPSGWKPPAADDCAIAWVEMIPIARGYVPSAVEDHKLDAIYGLGTKFLCMPNMTSQEDAEQFYESLSPEEKKFFEQGMSDDSQ